MSEYQEEVLTNLLDLQAELRGDEPELTTSTAAAGRPRRSVKADPADGQETVAVIEESVTVSVPSVPPPRRRRERAARRARRAPRPARVRPRARDEAHRTDRSRTPRSLGSGSTDAEVDERWHAFLDLQKIVADRLDQR